MRSRNVFKTLITLCLIISLFLSSSIISEASGPNLYSKMVSESIVNRMKTVKGHSQLILVTADRYNQRTALVQTFTRESNGKWHRQLIISGIIGKSGFTHHFSEWSNGTPEGNYTITQAFGRYSNPGTKLPYHKINKSDVWVDNVDSKYYNSLQNMYRVHQYSEKMYVPAYNYGFVINYNTKRIKGKGSAVFFHVDTHKYGYTLGCTAVSQNYVKSVVKWLNPKSKPIIIETVKSELSNY